MPSYKLNHFTMADAQALAGKTADITEWADDELATKVTYPAARIIDRIGPYLLIETTGAERTDAQTGAHLGTRPPEPELTIGFTGICEVTNVRDQATPAIPAPYESTQASGQPRYQRGDRIALEHTTDPYTRLQPGDQGTVTGYEPKLAQLDVAWDSGSTLSMLLADDDQIRIIATSPDGFQAAFLTSPAALGIDYQTYTTDVDPADLLNGAGNSASPPPIDIPAADDALAADGYTRLTAWTCTDEVWGAVVRRISAKETGQ